MALSSLWPLCSMRLVLADVCTAESCSSQQGCASWQSCLLAEVSIDMWVWWQALASWSAGVQPRVSQVQHCAYHQEKGRANRGRARGGSEGNDECTDRDT